MKNEQQISSLEILFIVLIYILFSGGFMGFLLQKSGSTDTNVLLNLLFFSSFSITLIILLNSGGINLEMAKQNKLLYLLFVGSIISVAWSVYPFESIKKVMNLIGCLLVAIYLSKRLTLYQLLSLLSEVLFVLSILSLVLIVFFPKLGLMGLLDENGKHLGAWKGVFIHKNVLGKAMFIQFMITCYLFKYSFNFKFLLFGLLAFILVLGSGSSTALILSVLSLLIILAFTYSGKVKLWAKLFLLSLLILSGVVLSNIQVILEFFGRDLTLTGRTFLWAELIGYIQDKPFLGYGYKAFWAGTGDLFKLSWKEAPHAHNSFVDIALDLGLLGVFAYLVFLVNQIRYFFSLKNESTVWGVTFFVIMIIYDFSESSALRYNNFCWFLMVLTCLSIARSGQFRGEIEKTN